MRLEMVGLGGMGSNMVRRLLRGGHQCVVFNRSPKPVEELVKEKATAASDLVDVVKKLAKPRTVWLMVPAAAVESTIAQLVAHPEAGDILIDGGNSYYIDDIAGQRTHSQGDSLCRCRHQRRRAGPRTCDSGEGRWTIVAAIDEAVPAHVLTTALYERFSSRGEADFANKLLSAMRYQFGGRAEKVRRRLKGDLKGTNGKPAF